jgi:TRAP-type C4-dicarboxylate transport system permease small subunit
MLKTLIAIYDHVISGLFALAGVLLVTMVIVILWDASFRSLGIDAPIWLPTFTEYSLSLLTMLVAPYLVRLRRHVTMDIFDNMISLKALRWWVIATDLVCAILCVILAYYAFSGGLSAYLRGEIDMQAIDLPRWLTYSFLAPGFLLCALEFLRHMIAAIAGREEIEHTLQTEGV